MFSDAVHKVVIFFSNPANVGMGILIGAAIGLRFGKRFRRLCDVVFVTAVVWLYLWSIPLTSWIIGCPLENTYPPETVENVPNADVICVLGGGMGMDTNVLVYADMGLCADRVWQGARLYRAGKAPLIALTGPKVRSSTAPLLIDFGVPESAFVYFEDGLNTEDEARMISDAGYKKVVLVTSAWHMRRARLLFERRGIEVVPSACDYMVYGPLYREDSCWYDPFVPSVEALSKNSYLFKEHFAYWCYRILDWVHRE